MILTPETLVIIDNFTRLRADGMKKGDMGGLTYMLVREQAVLALVNIIREQPELIQFESVLRHANNEKALR